MLRERCNALTHMVQAMPAASHPMVAREICLLMEVCAELHWGVEYEQLRATLSTAGVVGIPPTARNYRHRCTDHRSENRRSFAMSFFEPIKVDEELEHELPRLRMRLELRRHPWHSGTSRLVPTSDRRDAPPSMKPVCHRNGAAASPTGARTARRRQRPEPPPASACCSYV